MAEALKQLFEQLLGNALVRPGVGAYAVLPIPDYPGHLIGITSELSPCVLLSAQNNPVVAVPSLRLRGLEIRYDLPCQIIAPNREQAELRLTAIICTSNELPEQSYFIHAAEIVLKITGINPTFSTVVAETKRLVSIFQQLAQPQRESLTGLLGELVVLLVSSSALRTISAWRSEIDDRYDFVTLENARIEVKATRGRIRRHHLNYEQCDPPAGGVALLASIFIESAGGGTSVGEVLSAIEMRLAGNASAILKLHEVVAATLGDSLLDAMHERFDLELAKQSLRFFNISDIPAIRGQLPSGISDVSFVSDLSFCTAVDIARVASEYPSIRDLLPSSSEHA